MAYVDYEKYLLSDQWLEIKKQARELYKTCVLCDSTIILHVHHRHYNSLGHENLTTDLILLCKICHRNFHKGYMKTSEGFIYENARIETEQYLEKYLDKMFEGV